MMRQSTIAWSRYRASLWVKLSSRVSELLGRGREGAAALTVKGLVKEFERAALRGGGRLVTRYADTARRLAIHLDTLEAGATHIFVVTAWAAGRVLRCQIGLQTSIMNIKPTSRIRFLENGSLKIHFLKFCQNTVEY